MNLHMLQQYQLSKLTWNRSSYLIITQIPNFLKEINHPMLQKNKKICTNMLNLLNFRYLEVKNLIIYFYRVLYLIINLYFKKRNFIQNKCCKFTKFPNSTGIPPESLFLGILLFKYKL